MNTGEKIGAGRDKEVFRHGLDEDKVVALYEHPVLPQEGKSILYLNRLVRLLLPGTSIHIRVSGVLEDGKGFQESTYVPHDPDHKMVQEVTTDKRNVDDPLVKEARVRTLALRHTKPFQDLLEDARQKGFYFDQNVVNYIQNPDGSLTYTDFGPAFIAGADKNNLLTGTVRFNFDIPKVRTAIDQLQGPEKTEAENTLKRIMELAMEVQELKNKPV